MYVKITLIHRSSHSISKLISLAHIFFPDFHKALSLLKQDVGQASA